MRAVKLNAIVILNAQAVSATPMERALAVKIRECK